MNFTQLIKKAVKSPEYFEGLKDAVEYLSQNGQGIGMLRELVKSIQKDEESE